MKKRMISCILALTVSMALCACSSSQSSSKDTKEETTKQSSEKTEEQSSDASKSSDAEKTNDLPVGYVAEDGYYNSYFGFKFMIEEDDQELPLLPYMVRDYILVCNNLDTSNIDSEDNKAVEDALSGYLESNGAACVYSYVDQAIVIGDETANVSVSVHKMNGKSLDEMLAEEKESIKQYINYLSHSEATQSTVDFAGESRDCLTYVKDNESNPDGSDGTPTAIIYCVKDDYVCEIGIKGYHSLETVLTAFDKF